MKKLLLLPLLLLAFMVKAQLPVLRSPDGVTVEDTRLYILKNFRIPIYNDTTAANLQKGLDSIGTIFNKRGTNVVFIRTQSLGAFHKWDTLGASSSGGGAAGDTVFLYQIGTAAGQIETLYAVDGNLRKSRWVPGYGTLPFLAPDSAAYIDIDTTSIAYKTWVISLFGTSINNLQQVIDNGHILNRNDTITGTTVLGVPQFALNIDSLTEFIVNQSGTGDGSQFFGFNGLSNLSVNQNNVSQYVISVDVSKSSQTVNNGDSLKMQSYLFGGDTTRFTMTPTTVRLIGLTQANDTTVYKPLGIASTGLIKRMDGWAGGGGGGSSNGVGRDTVQTYTSGTTLTQSASTNYIQVNPASVQAALTITTLASGGTWHTSNDLYIVFGGTVTSGNPVITSFTLTAGSGLTLVEAVTPSGVVNAGEVIHYHKIGTVLYRIN